jgi:hypothetical protein
MRTTAAFRFALCGALAVLAGCGDMHEEEPVEERVSGLTFSTLPLLNGWANYGFGTAPASHAFHTGFVHLKGAIKTSGTNPVAFILPAGSRPDTNVYLPVNLCNATKGRLTIVPNGTVSVSAEGGAFSNAQCFTSLDGASFVASTIGGFTALTLQNGWTNAPFGTRAAAVKNVDDVIRFKGAINNGTSSTVFTLPGGMAPSTIAYLPLDLCDGTKGRLKIDIAGTATVSAEGPFSNAQCFTSLEGVSYPLNPAGPSGFTCLTPQNGWVGMPFSTRMPCVKNVGGIVRLLGAVSTSGSNPVPITLPVGVRPSVNTYVSVDLCNAKQGRVFIQPSGAVTVQPKGPFSDAQCFTSLEGVTFGL